MSCDYRLPNTPSATLSLKQIESNILSPKDRALLLKLNDPIKAVNHAYGEIRDARHLPSHPPICQSGRRSSPAS